MNYRETVAHIQTLPSRGWKGNLERMAAALALAKEQVGVDPRDHRSFVHVTGTNGKGTVTAYVESILAASGRRTGGYYSPFVYTIRERIRRNGRLISRADFAKMGSIVRGIDERLQATQHGALSEFEFKTLMGFLYWSEKQCSHVALEVGIGGRLDSTNVLRESVAVIASIGLDHVGILGDTLEKIAAEKAGIIRPGCPVVTGRLAPGPASVVASIARERGASVQVLGRDFDWRETRDGMTVQVGDRAVGPLRPAIRGAFAEDNLSIAVVAALLSVQDLSDQAITRGAEEASLPGRFEIRAVAGKTFVLDGAHNEPAAQGLASELMKQFPDQRIALVGGMVGGHDAHGVFTPMRVVVDEAHFAPINFHRGVPPQELLHQVGNLFQRAIAHESLEDALMAAATADVVVVMGSFYLVGEAGHWLAKAPLAV